MIQLSLPVGEPVLARMPSEPIIRTAEITGQYRWTLKRAWGAGPCIMWCGLNPSTADGERDDPTMLREIGFSYRWGFGSLVKVNIYPFRSSKPTDLFRWRRSPAYDEADGENFAAIRDEIQKAQVFVAAWGNDAMLPDVNNLIQGLAIQCDFDEDFALPPFKCLGLTKSGAPIHPLARGKHRVPDRATLIDWKHTP
jgi:hypothetical protein